MRFKGINRFTHAQPDKLGVLLVNLGTPEAPTKKALRSYLGEFLSDTRVVEIPKLLWLLILHGIVLRIRPKRSAEIYKSIWTDRGSPLMFHTQDQCLALGEKLKSDFGEQLNVRYAMRYGTPSIADVTQDMLENGVRRLLVLPLYPQYSGSTTGSTFDALSKEFKQRRWLPHLRFISSYHDFQPYIDALASKIEAYWFEYGRAEKLIFSFHGVPLHFLKQGDPYHCQCHATARLLAQKLGLQEHEYLTTFQSRFGKAEWLKPYTEQTLKALPGEGTKHVQVVCPGFSADCLETLEEIAIENRHYFLESGGERYDYIPAMNADEAHIDALAELLKQNLAGWPIQQEQLSQYECSLRDQNYQKHTFNK